MLGFLKKLFSTEQKSEVEVENIGISDIEEWFDERARTAAITLEREIKEILININQEIANTKANISMLLSASLHNPKISVREVQFMEGNRNSYVLAVNNFLRMMELEGKSYGELSKACDDFAARLEKFGQNTIRPYHILREFFANESRDIAINIKNIEQSMIKLKKVIIDSKIGKIAELKETISTIRQKAGLEKEIGENLENSIKLKKGIEARKAETEKKLLELAKQKDHKELLELKSDKEAVLASIRETENSILNTFSTIERPLRKLNRILTEDNSVLEKYLESAVNALLLDKELKILNIIRKLEDNINNLTLDLKDKKREKVLSCIKGMDRESMLSFQNRHAELSMKLKDIEARINLNLAFREEKKLRFDIGIAENDLLNVKNEIDNHAANLGKINLSNMKKELSDKMNQALGVNIAIV